jgi:hypothetical protein
VNGLHRREVQPKHGLAVTSTFAVPLPNSRASTARWTLPPEDRQWVFPAIVFNRCRPPDPARFS